MLATPTACTAYSSLMRCALPMMPTMGLAMGPGWVNIALQQRYGKPAAASSPSEPRHHPQRQPAPGREGENIRKHNRMTTHHRTDPHRKLRGPGPGDPGAFAPACFTPTPLPPGDVSTIARRRTRTRPLPLDAPRGAVTDPARPRPEDPTEDPDDARRRPGPDHPARRLPPAGLPRRDASRSASPSRPRPPASAPASPSAATPPAPATPPQDLRLDGRRLTPRLRRHRRRAGAAERARPRRRGPDRRRRPRPRRPSPGRPRPRSTPSANTALEGLYMSNGMYCTQCEAQGFRKITYWPDRPDVMARFRVRIEGRPRPVLLSNGNLVASGPGWAEWEDPWPKPSYLFALVAGDLVAVEDRFTTASGRDVLLQIWVRPGDEDRCAYAMDALKRSMRWDEERLRPRIRPRPLHDRRRRRLQHGGDGEQGPQRLQLPATCWPAPRPPPTPTTRRSRRSSPTNISTTGPATASPAATGSSSASRKASPSSATSNSPPRSAAPASSASRT